MFYLPTKRGVDFFLSGFLLELKLLILLVICFVYFYINIAFQD